MFKKLVNYGQKWSITVKNCQLWFKKKGQLGLKTVNYCQLWSIMVKNGSHRQKNSFTKNYDNFVYFSFFKNTLFSKILVWL